MASEQHPTMANGIQRVAASLYNNPDDDFKHVAGTTPGTEHPFTQNTSFVDRVAAYGHTSAARGESSASGREANSPEEYHEDADAAATSFTIPDEESCAQHVTTTEEHPTHPQHVHASPAHEPLPPPQANAVPVDPGALPEFVPVVTGVAPADALLLPSHFNLALKASSAT